MESLELLSKSDAHSMLGKTTIWSKERSPGSMGYLSGIAAFDPIVLSALAPPITALDIRPKGLKIDLMTGFKIHCVGLLNEQIISITMEDKEQIKTLKEKSVVGRALVGGLLLGPAGALIGGMSGIGKKEVTADTPDIIISITHTQGVILLSTKHKHRAAIAKFLGEHFEQFTLQPIPEPGSEKGPGRALSIVEEIEKLAGLKERGIISDAEFDRLKAKLLE